MRHPPHKKTRTRALFTLALAALAAPALSAQILTWDFEPAPDEFSEDALLDLRPLLNEPYAGSKGWIKHNEHGQFYHEDTDEIVRFWVVNTGVPSTFEATQRQARFQAKRGVNMARWHTSVFDNNGPSLDYVNPAKVDELHRLVAANKAEGIYTSISFYFSLSLRMNPAWGIDGYTAEFLAENNRQPFGLLFVDEDMQAAHRNWIKVLLTTPNPYDNGTLLATDPAINLIEIQNEDNLFWNFDAALWPVAQQHKIDKMFGDFVAEKYGSIQAGVDAWGPITSNAFNRDNITAGRLTVTRTESMISSEHRVPRLGSLRIADQIEFVSKLKYDFYADYTAYLRELGYEGPVSASNWMTKQIQNLQDIEHWTYTAAGVIDIHAYYNSQNIKRGTNNSIGGGDEYLSVPTVNNPRSNPTNFKHIKGYPSFISESSWTHPHDHRAEAAWSVAAYASMNGLDGFTWFAAEGGAWQDGIRTWQVFVPMTGGLFPAAALAYRRGDIQEAPVVVQESRSLDSTYRRELNEIRLTSGFDPLRLPEGEEPFDPATGDGTVDSLAFSVGRVEMDIGPDVEDGLFVHPHLEQYVDYDKKTLSSITGEMEIFWGTLPNTVMPDFSRHPGSGYMLINTARTQAAIGYLDAAGQIQLPNVNIRMRNKWGSVGVTSLDHKPISQSTKLLVQVGTRDERTDWTTAEIPFVKGDGVTVYGKRIESLGRLPWKIERNDRVRVTLKDVGEVLSVKTLDMNGNFLAENTSGSQSLLGYNIDVAPEAVYTIVELAEPEETPPVIATKALRNAEIGQEYSYDLQAISGTGNLTWSVSGLPAGLSSNASGIISGTPTASGPFTLSVTVTDTASLTDTRNVSLFVMSEGDTAPACPEAGYADDPGLHWVYHYGDCWLLWDADFNGNWGLLHVGARNEDGTGWVYHFEKGWIYLYSGSVTSFAMIYSLDLGWLAASEGYGAGQYYRYETDDFETWVSGN